MRDRTAIVVLVGLTALVAAATFAGADWLFAGYAIGMIATAVILELTRNR